MIHSNMLGDKIKTIVPIDMYLNIRKMKNCSA